MSLPRGLLVIVSSKIGLFVFKVVFTSLVTNLQCCQEKEEEAEEEQEEEEQEQEQEQEQKQEQEEQKQKQKQSLLPSAVTTTPRGPVTRRLATCMSV